MAEIKEKKQVSEPIMAECKRISAIPLDPKYKKIWANYKRQKATFWVPEKIKYTDDAKTFAHLPKDIQHSTKMVLGFFAGSDEIVEENIQERFLHDITIPEIKNAYVFQAMMENIHSEVYNLMIMSLLPAGEDRDKLFKAVENTKTVSAKAAWARKWISSQKSYAHRCVAFACVEGILFSSSFAFIDWLKSQKYTMTGLFEANQYISNDEARHTELACLIYDQLENKLTPAEIKEIIDEAIAIEIDFAKEVLPADGHIGLNHRMMTDHIRHCGAILANWLGHSDLYKNTHCPFAFMTKRSFAMKDNFFEGDGNNYNISGVGESQESEKFAILDSW